MAFTFENKIKKIQHVPTTTKIIYSVNKYNIYKKKKTEKKSHIPAKENNHFHRKQIYY